MPAQVNPCWHERARIDKWQAPDDSVAKRPHSTGLRDGGEARIARKDTRSGNEHRMDPHGASLQF